MSNVAPIAPKALRSGSVSETLARSMVAMLEIFSSEDLAIPLARALSESFLHVNNPEPQLVDSILICLRDIVGESARDNLVKDALIGEIEQTLSPQTLFRSGSVGTRLFAALYRTEGADWLNQALRPLFTEVSNLTHAVEFDPAKMPPGSTEEDIQRGAQDFEAIAKRFFNHLFMLAEDFPPCVSRILAPVCEAAEKKFPGRGSSVAGIGLVMLRYVSPAVLQPNQFCVTAPDLSPIALRVIVVLSKVIQMVANGIVVKPNDVAMQPLSGFIQSLFNPCAEFIKQCTAKPMVDPLPPLQISETNISKELRNALKVLASEVDKNFDKISAKAKESNDAAAQAALQRLKNLGKKNAARPPAPAVKGAGAHMPSFSFRRNADHAKSVEEADDEVEPPKGTYAEVANATTLETKDPVNDAVMVAHKTLDEMLAKFRGSVLAFTGENFARVAEDCERYKIELEKEREQRQVAERLVKTLQDQVEQLQAEVATLRANAAAAAAAAASSSSISASTGSRPASGVLNANMNFVQPRPNTSISSDSIGSPLHSHLPCAPQVRQAIALVEEITLLTPRISKVAQVLYLARIVRDLQRLVRTPYNEPFEFSKRVAYDPNAGDGSGVTFDDEKMQGLRRAIPDCLSKAHEWCQNILSPGTIPPSLFPATALRIQNLVDLLKDVSQNLRQSFMA